MLQRLADPGSEPEQELALLIDSAAGVVPVEAARLGLESLRRQSHSVTLARKTATVLAQLQGKGESEALTSELAAIDGDPARAEAVKLLVSAGRPALAAEVAASIDGADYPAGREAAKALSGAGFAVAAAAVLERAGDAEPTRRQRARVEEQLGILSGWRPALAPASVEQHPGRILQLVQTSIGERVSGYTVRTHQLARLNRSRGLDHRVLTLAGYGSGAEQAPGWEEIDGVPYRATPLPGAGQLFPAERLTANADWAKSLVAEFGPRLIVASSDYQNALAALSLREATGVPVAYDVRGFWEETWLARQPAEANLADSYIMRREVNLSCMNEADVVITLSSTMRETLADRGLSRDRIEVVPHLVDPDSIAPDDSGAPELRQALGIGEAEFVVGYAGSILAYEGLDLLLHAVEQVRGQGVAVSCLLIGDGPQLGELRELALELGLGSALRIVGQVPHSEVGRYLRLLDAFAMPRLDLPVCRLVTPLKPWEAMAAGIPLITSSVAPLQEILDDSGAGLSHRPGASEELAARLVELATNRGLGAELGAAGRETVRGRWQRWLSEPSVYEDLALS